ncbi:MAG: VOC family protein [Pseudomonadota bacterium]
MAHGDFVWCDLSTLDQARAERFYNTVFGWDYTATAQPDGSPYSIASISRREAAGLFPMPEKFRAIGLPSFWMSYIQVDDIDDCITKAERRGAKVEVRPLDFGDGAKIALIRDPLGAGFTVYQGNGLSPRSDKALSGAACWNALYVSDLSAVEGFYATLFDWTIELDIHDPTARIAWTAQGAVAASLHEVGEDIRGSFEFWGVHFAVHNLNAAKEAVTKSGGRIEYEGEDGRGPFTLARDPDEAAFFIRPAAGGVQIAEAASATRWKTIGALIALFAAMGLGQYWVWGLVFLMWTWPSLKSGEIFFVETISRGENPILYWLIFLSWVSMSLWVIATGLGLLPAGWA